MQPRILLITVFCITPCFTSVATAQNGRLLNSRRQTPYNYAYQSNYYPVHVTRYPRLSPRQMDQIYGPSILVRTQRKSSDASQAPVLQPR